MTLTDLAADDESPPEVVVDDRAPLSYLYTSGTTSFPKGVVGTHLAIYLESMSAALDSGWNAADRFIAMMPMFHTAQLNAFCTPAVIVGATIHVQRGFDPERFLDDDRARADHAGLRPADDVPGGAGAPVVRRARDLSSLRRAVYAMAPMPEAQIKACLDGFGCDFALLFGQTEMSPITTLFRPEHQLTHVGAVGTPLTGVQVGIMGPDGRAAAGRGEQGEIVYRGPSTMQEYLHDPDATAAAFAHGWFHSGDVGRFGDDGVLWFADRYKDVIKTGGENVASIEVERAVYDAEPDVAEVVVVGLPHERWSEAITAVVVPKPGDDGRRRRADRRAQGAPRRLQGPEGGDRRRRAPAHLHRQDPEERRPRHPRDALRRALTVAVLTSPARHRRRRRTRATGRPSWRCIAALDEQLALAVAGGGERYVQRHRDRGKLPVRERLELLLDPDTPFLELSPLAAWGTDFTVGASVLTGIGVVSGRRVRGHRPRPDGARRRDEPLLAAEDAAGPGDRPRSTGCR